MTNPNINLAGPKQALQTFANPPSATAEERATWGRDDARFHRERVNDHYLRTAFDVAAHLEMLVKALEEVFGAHFILADDPNRVSLYNEDGSPRPNDEIRAEGMRKAAALDAAEAAKPDMRALRALESFLVTSGESELLLTFQGILRSHEAYRAQALGLTIEPKQTAGDRAVQDAMDRGALRARGARLVVVDESPSNSTISREMRALLTKDHA